MNPNVWGPHAWIFLHFITLNYPKNPTEIDKYNMTTFFKSLEHVLPCDTCRLHYKDNIEEKYPLTDYILSSRENLVKWLIDVHNVVNKMNNKSILLHDDVINMYSDMHKSGMSQLVKHNSSSSFNDVITTCIIIICIILLVLTISSIGYNYLNR